MKLILAIFLPIISGFIGWLTNYLAVKMLFYPREPIYFFGYKIQGVFPKRQAFIADKIAQLVANELLVSKEIFGKIKSQETLDALHLQVEKKLHNYFDNNFEEKFPLMAKLMPNKFKWKIITEVSEELRQLTPEIIESQVNYLEGKLDIEVIVKQKVNQLSIEKLEAVLWDILNEEFKFIEWFGAILGFLIGLIQVLIAYFLL